MSKKESNPGEIHLRIIEVLRRFPEGISGGQIRQELEKEGLRPAEQTHLDRRKRDLKKWFGDEIIVHAKIREQLEKSGRKAEVERRRRRHRELSKFTHRSYRALLKGYSLGVDDKMVYDGYTKWAVLPHTVSAYYAILAALIIQNSESIQNSGLVSVAEIEKIWKQSLEKTTVPRKFTRV